MLSHWTGSQITSAVAYDLKVNKTANQSFYLWKWQRNHPSILQNPFGEKITFNLAKQYYVHNKKGASNKMESIVF